MHIVLSESQEDFVRLAVSEGRYTSESEVVALAIRLVQAHEEKLDLLRARLTSAIEAGGSNTSEDMEVAMEAQLQRLHSQGIPW